MKSPITGKEMKLIKEPGVLTYRKENFEIVYHYYLCDSSKEHFTTDEIDTINIQQALNQYRAKYGIPFPDEIIKIREKYHVSASKMSEILGLGANTYRLYETGEMPSVANGRLILSVKEPIEFLRQVTASAHLLIPRDREKIEKTVNSLLDLKQKDPWDRLFDQKIFTQQSPDEYTGYREPQLEKIAHMIKFFSEYMDIYKTKLNKLLFYSDFCTYKKTAYSITGIAYRAIQFGPVPAEYDKLYIKMCDDDLINITEVEFENGFYGDLIKPRITFNDSIFSKLELEIMNKVALAFKDKKTSDIVNTSHSELGWKDNHENKNMISYQKYAFSICGI